MIMLMSIICFCFSTEEVACPQLVAPVNGDVTTGSLSVNSIATYSCDEGYFINGPTTRTCGEDGAWIEPEPSCQSTT